MKITLILLSFVIISGCASPFLLKIDELMTCLTGSKKIQRVTHCISAIDLYRDEGKFEGGRLRIDFIKDFCEGSPYYSCSNRDLAERLTLTTGKLKTFNESGDIINIREYGSVAEPAHIFSSKLGYPLGGASVRVFIFYNENNGDVIGWLNMGAARLSIDLNINK